MQPLTSQEALLRLGIADPRSAAPVIVSLWRHDGAVDPDALLAAVAGAVRETEAFAFGAVPDGAAARLVPAEPAAPRIERFAGDAARAAWLWELRTTPIPFDGSALAAATVAAAGDDHAVVFRAHHGVLDGYGLTLVMRRIAARYEAELAGRPLPHARLGDLAALAAAASPARPPDLEFWAAALDGVGAPGREITFDPRVAAPTGRPLRHRRPVAMPGPPDRPGWPTEAIATVGAYVAGRLGTTDAVLGVVSALRSSEVERRTPAQLAAAIPTRVRLGAAATPASAGADVRRWLDAAVPRVRAGDRPERLLGAVAAAWRTGRLHGPLVNVLPYTRVGPWEVDVIGWGPVADCLISITPTRDGGLRLDGEFHPDLYSDAEAAGHVAAIARLLEAALAAPDVPFAAHAVPARPAPAGRVPIPGGYAVPAQVESALAAAGFAPATIAVRSGRGLTVELRDVPDDALDRARAVLPPGVRLRRA